MRGWSFIRELDRLYDDAEFWERYADRLHPDEAAAIAEGDIGILKRPVEPTWTAGEWLEVRSNLWMRPHKPKFTHRGWRITFDLRDFRTHLVRRVPPMFDPPELDSYGEPIPPRAGAIMRARLDGSYTASHELAVPEDDEAPDPIEIDDYRASRESKARQVQAQADLIAAAENVMAAIKERAEASPDFQRKGRLTLHRIRRELDRFIERERRKVA